MLVSDVYTRVCDALLEPAGLVLGLVTYAQFSAYLSDSLLDFLRLTGMSKMFVTQTIQLGIRQYVIPNIQASIEQVFVQGRFIPRSTLDSIDNSHFQWQRKVGVPRVWHTDGLPIKTVEIVFAPNWQGFNYSGTDSPPSQNITAATTGIFGGTASSDGTNEITRLTGEAFWFSDATWQGRQITLGTTPATVTYVISQVIDGNHLLATDLVTSNAGQDWLVSYPINLPVADRNLTTYGSQLPTQKTYALTDTLPLVPESAALYLAFGVLQKIYQDDSELKDSQKAMYCGARFTEGVNVFRAAVLEQLGDDDDE